MRPKMEWLLAGMMTASLACGGKSGNASSDAGPPKQPPNPCATMNFTYSVVLSEQPGGTCAFYAPSPFCQKGASEVMPCVMKVNVDGTISLPANMTCASFTVTGCTTRGSDCTYASNGESLTESFEATFAESGIVATGTLSITGMGDGPSCSSMFSMTASRM